MKCNFNLTAYIDNLINIYREKFLPGLRTEPEFIDLCVSVIYYTIKVLREIQTKEANLG